MGCSLDTKGSEGDGVDGGRDVTIPVSDAEADVPSAADTTPGDVSPSDAPSADATDPDAGSADAGSSDAAADAGFDASDIPYACSHTGTIGPDCKACKGYPLACVYCAGHRLVGECLQGGDHCQQHVPAGSSTCPCEEGDAEACVLADQVCLGPDAGCGTCGQGDSDGLSCQGGGTCHRGSSQCK